jgi:hypothetical protein
MGGLSDIDLVWISSAYNSGDLGNKSVGIVEWFCSAESSRSDGNITVATIDRPGAVFF